MLNNFLEIHLGQVGGPSGPTLNGEDPTGVQNVAMQRQMHQQQQLHHIMQQQQQVGRLLPINFKSRYSYPIWRKIKQNIQNE